MRATGSKTLVKASGAVLGLLSALALCEVVLRLVGFPPAPDAIDPELGWAPRFTPERLPRANACGEEITRTPMPEVDLLKVGGPGARRVLCIGDSFTYAKQVSTGYAYYDVLEARSEGGLSVFASGAGGYGTAQELLPLERLVDRVRPDILVWQFTGNDLHDNVQALNQGAILRGSYADRPYMDPETGEITMRPSTVWLTGASRVARIALYGLRRSSLLEPVARWLDWLVEPSPDQQAELEALGLRVVTRALERVHRRLPQLEVHGFSVDGEHEADLRAVFEAAGAAWVPDVGARVATRGPIDCSPEDSHWNHLGHLAAGELLASELR